MNKKEPKEQPPENVAAETAAPGKFDFTRVKEDKIKGAPRLHKKTGRTAYYEQAGWYWSVTGAPIAAVEPHALAEAKPPRGELKKSGAKRIKPERSEKA